MTPHRSLTAAVFYCALLLWTQRVATAQPSLEFLPEDPKGLSVRVIRSDPLGEGAANPLLGVQRFQLEVRNKTKWQAEPLVFEFEAKGKPTATVVRFPAPHFGRAGQAIKPGAKETYLVETRWEKDWPRPDVRVSRASFFKGRHINRFPAEIKSITTKRMNEFGREIEATEVLIVNSADYAVDVTYDAELTAPTRGQVLVQTRLLPKEERVWTITGAHWMTGAVIKSLKPLDWTGQIDEGAAEARQMLELAFENLQGKAPPGRALKGRFVLGNRPGDVNSPLTERRGRFSCPSQGPLSVAIDGGSSDIILRSVTHALERSLAFWRWPRVEELAKDHRFVLLDWDRVQVLGPEFLQLGRDPVFLFKEGRIVATQRGASAELGSAWVSAPIANGYAIERLLHRNISSSKDPTEFEEWAYLEHGKTVVPQRYAKGSLRKDFQVGSTEIRLSDFEFEEELIARAAPRGSGVEALRKAWERPYSYADKPVKLSGDYEIRHSGVEGLWQGLEVIRGRFELKDFRGWMNGAKPWSAWEIDVVGALTPDAKKAIASVVEDRFRMWAGRDFCGRAPFDETFAGATITAQKDGEVFTIENGPFQAVAVREGLPVRLVYRPGHERHLAYRRLGDLDIAYQFETRPETLSGQFEELPGFGLFPTAMRLDKVFGPDWEERIVFSKLKLESP